MPELSQQNFLGQGVLIATSKVFISNGKDEAREFLTVALQVPYDASWVVYSVL